MNVIYSFFTKNSLENLHKNHNFSLMEYTRFIIHVRRREVVAKMMTRVFVTTCDTRTDDYREIYIQVGSDNVTGSYNNKGI